MSARTSAESADRYRFGGAIAVSCFRSRRNVDARTAPDRWKGIRKGLHVHQLSRPLFRLDPGWPFVLAGLALLVAGILIPVQRELHDLRNELRKVESSELRTYARLEAYDRFLGGLQQADPDIVRRLAIAQLNVVPKGEESFLLTPGMNQTVAQWIDESVPTRTVTPDPYPDTLLGRIALGPNRLWLLGSAVFLLFVGLLLGPESGRAAVLERSPREPTDPVDAQKTDEQRHAETLALPALPPAPASSAPLDRPLDRMGAFVAAATFVDRDDADFGEPSVADVVAAMASRIDQRSGPVLVVDDSDLDDVEDDVIDVELVARCADSAEAPVVDAELIAESEPAVSPVLADVVTDAVPEAVPEALDDAALEGNAAAPETMLLYETAYEDRVP